MRKGKNGEEEDNGAEEEKGKGTAGEKEKKRKKKQLRMEIKTEKITTYGMEKEGHRNIEIEKRK